MARRQRIALHAIGLGLAGALFAVLGFQPVYLAEARIGPGSADGSIGPSLSRIHDAASRPEFRDAVLSAAPLPRGCSPRDVKLSWDLETTGVHFRAEAPDAVLAASLANAMMENVAQEVRRTARHSDRIVEFVTPRQWDGVICSEGSVRVHGERIGSNRALEFTTRSDQIYIDAGDGALDRFVIARPQPAFRTQVIWTVSGELLEDAWLHPASAPGRPVKRRARVDFGSLLLIFLMLWLFARLLKDCCRSATVSPADTAIDPTMPLLGTVSGAGLEGALLLSSFPANSRYAERWQRAVERIREREGFEAAKTLLVTSPGTEEESHAAGLNLAIALARSGRQVAFVEANLRAPYVRGLLHLREKEGLCECVLGLRRIEDVLQETPIPSLRAMTGGQIIESPVPLTELPGFTEMLQKLGEQVDLVVLNAPAVVPVPDSRSLAPRVDGIVMVAEPNSTSREKLRRSLSELEGAGGKLLGVLLVESAETSLWSDLVD